ncbi:MAG TPA: hypothetical protein VG963_33990 [Polyangiaceae bacterium]|nr:hypothetical protein [Polyangiaceae bacterium]HVZ37498.1 hypothetical protein [Polyangiaceae bacterium]
MSIDEHLVSIVEAAVRRALDGSINVAPATPQLLTRNEAAELLKISPRQLDDLRSSKNPPPELRVGKAPRFIADELIGWARGQAKGT